MNRAERNIETLITGAVEALGCVIWGIEYANQGRHSRLRIYIDKPEGVTVEDCERVSRQVSDVLDVAEVVNGQHTLEVSSPGMDRILFKPQHYRENVGAEIEVRLNFPFEGKKKIVGLLAGLENDEVVVQADGEEYVLPLENVQRARLVPQFD